MRFFLFDKIIHFEPGEMSVAIKNVSLVEEFFVKHYDRTPLMPEPLIIEALAQTGGWAVTVSTDFRLAAIMVRVDDVKFYNYVRPGDQLMLKATILSINENGSLVEGVAEVNGETVAHVGRIMYGHGLVSDQNRDFLRKNFIYTSGGFLDREGNPVSQD